ncbi:MAG TPA: tRNA (adenosine(37)-N6)-threonylcarbamoyltransferase complex dimerization subunit type 1 TsaB [Sedimentisphaerales bacterium]
MATNMGNFDNPLIVAIETSGRLGSVALAQGDKLLAESHFSGPMRHSAEIFPAITDLLSKFSKKPDQIEHVYISLGPGSFTGLRIAATIAKTIALANNAKIVAVDTLDCIAANISPQDNSQRLGVILDAKRGQFFIAVYEKTQDPIWKKVLPDCLMTAEEFLAQFTDKPIILTGEGLVFYKDKFAHKNIRVLDEKFWNPSAVNIHLLGWQLANQGRFADPLTLTPNYVRGPDAIVKQR